MKCILVITIVAQLWTLSESRCERGWKLFECHCYRYFLSEVTWEEAKRECRDYQAELVSIHSQLQNDFITDMLPMRAECWIGLHDSVTEKTWQWIDNSETQYLNWARGQPNSKDRDQDCVEFWSVENTWNDESCAVANPFICKKPADIQGAVDAIEVLPMASEAVFVVTTGGECISHLEVSDYFSSKTWTQQKSLGQGTHAFTVSPLQPCTDYSVSVAGVYKVDTHRISNPVNVTLTTTMSELPPVPLYNTTLTEKKAVVTWKYEASSCISHYIASYQWIDPLSTMCGQPQGCLGPIKEEKVENIESSYLSIPTLPCKTYLLNLGYFTIFDQKVYTGNTTIIRSPCTGQEVAEIPNITLKQNDSSVSVTWRNAEESAIKKYIIHYQQINGNNMGELYEDSVSAWSTSYTTKPLSQCSIYSFNLGLLTNFGDVKFSKTPTTFVTPCGSTRKLTQESAATKLKHTWTWFIICLSISGCNY